MAIDLSGYGDSTNYENNDSDTLSDENEGFYDDRIDEFEQEWKAQSIRRFIDHVCEYFGIDVENDVGCSKWADIHSEKTEEIYGEDGLKDSNKEKYDGNLHQYKKQFGSPDYDYDEVNQDNADDFTKVEGMAEEFADDYDSIFLPEDFEVPEDLYYKPKVDISATGIADNISQCAEQTKGIGDKTVDRFEESVEENEELVLSLHCVDEMKAAIKESDELDYEEIVDSVIEN